MRGSAVAFGAVSIVNAIASGKGAALGVKLMTKADVELVGGGEGVSVEIIDAPEEDDRLAKEAVKVVLRRFHAEGSGAKVSVRSEIPIARGLKSSSAASNAVVLATLSCLGEVVDDVEAVNLGVDASLAAGVTITGAFDDASASYFGGAVVTDNVKRRILRRDPIASDLRVVLYVPEERLYTKAVDKQRLEDLGGLVDGIHAMALDGDHWKAMTLNGLTYAAALGFQPAKIIEAIQAGATAAGLSGTGPSFAAICHPEDLERVRSAWEDQPGRILVTEINNEKARVII